MNISILGTGLMGTAMGESIINAGFNLTVYNRTISRTQTLADKGAKVVDTAEEAIKGSDISIIVMLHGKAVVATLETLPAATFDGKIIICASSSTIAENEKMQKIVEHGGGQFVDMSIEVGYEQLAAGQGMVKVGASEATYAIIAPVLGKFMASVTRIGDVGEARKLEAVGLIGTMLPAINVAYAVAFAQKLGISAETYVPYIQMLVPGSEYFLGNMSSNNYDQVFAAIESFVQGVSTSIETAETLHIPTEYLHSALALYSKAIDLGYAGKDGSSVLEALIK